MWTSFKQVSILNSDFYTKTEALLDFQMMATFRKRIPAKFQNLQCGSVLFSQRGKHSPVLLRIPRFFHFCQIYAGQLFVDQPIEVALQGATNKNFITLL